MKDAIKNKDFNKFAELTMKDSNSFHSTCLDSYPPIFYINDTSKRIINLCHLINTFYETNIVAYTFDAGPNAVLYYLKENEDKLLSILNEICSKITGWNDKFSEEQTETWSNIYNDKLKNHFESFIANYRGDIEKHVTRVISTQVGPGPQSTEESLLDEATGLPK